MEQGALTRKHGDYFASQFPIRTVSYVPIFDVFWQEERLLISKSIYAHQTVGVFYGQFENTAFVSIFVLKRIAL